MRSADLPPEIPALFAAYIAGLQQALGDNLLGVYTRGSLALGDFDPSYSDVDLLVVTRQRVSDGEFARLRELHDRIRRRPDRFSEGMEAAYIDAKSSRRYVPGQKHATITSHDPLRWERHDSNWVLDRWQARERGEALYGPGPRDVFDPITHEELREAARKRIIEWANWAEDVPPADAKWLSERAHQAYVIETICRGLHALGHPGLPTKREAVNWASHALPEPWLDLLERSRDWRTQEHMDADTAQETLDFVRWAAQQASMSAE